ncbi:hypothetical protein AAY473_015450, partial [Plecturocebus cupreus]
MPKALRAHLLHQCALDMRHGVKGDYFGAYRFGFPPLGYLSPVAPTAGSQKPSQCQLPDSPFPRSESSSENSHLGILRTI